MPQRSTKHVVVGALTIVYGTVLCFVWTPLFVKAIEEHAPPLFVLVGVAVVTVPVLLLVTGIRLCRVEVDSRPRRPRLAGITIALLYLKAAVTGVIGTFLLLAYLKDPRAFLAGAVGMLALVLLALVAAPSVTFAILIGRAYSMSTSRSAEAIDYDDESVRFAEETANTVDEPPINPAQTRYSLELIIAVAAIGIAIWHYAIYWQFLSLMGCARLLGPFVLLAMASRIPTLRTHARKTLFFGLGAVVLFGSPLSHYLLAIVGGPIGIGRPMGVVTLLAWAAAALTILIAWLSSPLSKTVQASQPDLINAGQPRRARLRYAATTVVTIALVILAFGPWAQPFRDSSSRAGSNTSLETMAFHQGPGFLTEERRQQNLLTNGSFENGLGNDWTVRSWRGNQQAGGRISDFGKAGGASVRLSSNQSDDCMIYQRVSVKPHTRYYFAGWVRTDAVTITDAAGRFGAGLSVWGGFETSESVKGTCDWSYQVIHFESGDRTEIEVGCRLGHHGSLATGTAWFDDLVLVEFR